MSSYIYHESVYKKIYKLKNSEKLHFIAEVIIEYDNYVTCSINEIKEKINKLSCSIDSLEKRIDEKLTDLKVYTLEKIIDGKDK